MNTIRCPKCKLINSESIPRCRRCGASLSSDKNGDVSDSRSLNSNRAVRHWVVPVIVIVALLCIYGYYRYSQSIPISGTALAETNNSATNQVIAKSASANRELEEVKKLNRDFLGRLDQNMSDRQGEGFKKNQTLAYDMMMTLLAEQNKLTDAAALKHCGEFSRLVNTYYDQLVRFNSDKAHLLDANQKVSSEIEQIQQDPSLSDEEKFSRKRDLKGKNFDDALKYSGSANEIEETVKSLRNLLASGAAS
jgi:hypothetical protein